MTGKKIILNINMISIAIGAILFFTRIRLPELITNTISSVGNMIEASQHDCNRNAFCRNGFKKQFLQINVYISYRLSECLSFL